MQHARQVETEQRREGHRDLNCQRRKSRLRVFQFDKCSSFWTLGKFQCCFNVSLRCVEGHEVQLAVSKSPQRCQNAVKKGGMRCLCSSIHHHLAAVVKQLHDMRPPIGIKHLKYTYDDFVFMRRVTGNLVNGEPVFPPPIS